MLAVKNLPANAGDAAEVGSVLGWGRFRGGGNGNPTSVLAWRIPWTEEPGRLQPMGSQSWTRLSTQHTAGAVTHFIYWETEIKTTKQFAQDQSL